MASTTFDTKSFFLKNFSYLAKYRFLFLRSYKRILTVLQYLPGRSTSFGPPRGIYQDADSYNKVNPQLQIQEIKFAENQFFVRKLPLTNSRLVLNRFKRFVNVNTIDKTAFILPQARYLYGHGGTVITSDDKVFLPASPLRNEHNYKLHQSLSILKLPKFLTFDKVIVVDTRGCEDNFFHWMKDHLVRFYWIKQLNLDLSQYTLICSHGTAKYNRYSFERLKLFGFNFKEWLNVKEVNHFYAEELIIPPYSNHAFNMNSFTFYKPEGGFLKELFKVDDIKVETYERIYLSRRKSTRSSPQEVELVEVFKKYDVQEIFVEDYSVSEAVEIFSNAKIVVGFHGAGLTNIIFCKPGTTIIEIFGSDFIITDLWSLSNQFELDYYAYCNDELTHNVKQYRLARFTAAEIKVDQFIEFFEKVTVGTFESILPE